MATYSTNLALTLINTGDQAGTWGITTNTNLGTLLEQAISGYVTQAITDGADTTITIPNGATGVARNMYIECTGTLTANRNLVVPANKKLYFIYNNTSGGFAVTVKVAGQTGVSVPNGKKMVLVSNGTDVVNGLNYIAAFGTDSFTTTNLTATSGTITTLVSTSATATTLAATSANITTLSSTSANITTLTGTNASLTSLTLANALGIAEGGTGVDSTPTNGQLLIGNGTNFTLNTLNGGPGVGITNNAGSITITATGTGFIASVNATSPLQSVGTTSVTISIVSSTGTGAVVLAAGPTISSGTVTQLASTSATITTLKSTSATIDNLKSTSANITTATGTRVAYTSGTITNLSSTSANITTLTGTNASLTSLTLTNALKVAEGGTGVDSTPTNGQLLIGNGSGFALSTLTAGSGMTITNNAGSITLAAAGLPVVTVASSTAISASAGNHYVLTGTSTTITLPASPTISDTVYITVANSLTTNVVARNGKPIQGIAEDMTLDAPYASAQLRFTNNTVGWVLT